MRHIAMAVGMAVRMDMGVSVLMLMRMAVGMVVAVTMLVFGFGHVILRRRGRVRSTHEPSAILPRNRSDRDGRRDGDAAAPLAERAVV